MWQPGITVGQREIFDVRRDEEVIVTTARIGGAHIDVHLENERISDAVLRAVKRCSLVERTLNRSPIRLRTRLKDAATVQELKDLAELADRHLVD